MAIFCSEDLSYSILLPTFAKLIGANVPDHRILDGKDIMPVLLDNAESPHEYFFYSHWGTLEAGRWKDWKLRIIKEEALYNLKTDIGEKINLKDEHPEIVIQLKKAMQDNDAEVTKNARPVGHVENPKTLTLNGDIIEKTDTSNILTEIRIRFNEYF